MSYETRHKDCHDLADNIGTSVCFDFWLRTELMTLKREDKELFDKMSAFFANNPRTTGRERKQRTEKL